jgi:hypothetical protein
MIAKTILRMSPVDASASAAVSSENDEIGTVMLVPFSDQSVIHDVGVLSNAIFSNSLESYRKVDCVYSLPTAHGVTQPPPESERDVANCVRDSNDGPTSSRLSTNP